MFITDSWMLLATDRLRASIQAVGDSSTRATTLTPGTRVLIEGPYGALTADKWHKPRALMIAAGVGITPMRALLEDTPFAPADVTRIYRYTDHTTAIFLDELAELSDRRGIELIQLPGSRRAPSSWLPDDLGPDHNRTATDTDRVRAAVPDLVQRDVFICGSTPWTASVRKSRRTGGACPIRHPHRKIASYVGTAPEVAIQRPPTPRPKGTKLPAAATRQSMHVRVV